MLTRDMFTQYTALITFLDETDLSCLIYLSKNLQKNYDVIRKNGSITIQESIKVGSVVAALGSALHLDVLFKHKSDSIDALHVTMVYAMANQNMDTINFCLNQADFKNCNLDYVMEHGSVVYGPEDLFDHVYQYEQWEKTSQKLRTLARIALAHGQWAIFKKLLTADMDVCGELDWVDEWPNNKLLSLILQHNNFDALRYVIDHHMGKHKQEERALHILRYAFQHCEEAFIHRLLTIPMFEAILHDKPEYVMFCAGKMGASVFQRLLQDVPRAKDYLFCVSVYQGRTHHAWSSILEYGDRETAQILLDHLPEEQRGELFRSSGEGCVSFILLLIIRGKNIELLAFVLEKFPEVQEDFKRHYSSYFKTAFGADYAQADTDYLGIAVAFLKHSESSYRTYPDVEDTLVWFADSIFTQLRTTKMGFEKRHKTPYVMSLEHYTQYFDLLIHIQRFIKINIDEPMMLLSSIPRTSVHPLLSHALGFTLFGQARQIETPKAISLELPACH